MVRMRFEYPEANDRPDANAGATDWTQSSRGYDAARAEKRLDIPVIALEGSGQRTRRGGEEAFLGICWARINRRAIEGWQQFVVRARDERGDPVSD